MRSSKTFVNFRQEFDDFVDEFYNAEKNVDTVRFFARFWLMYKKLIMVYVNEVLDVNIVMKKVGGMTDHNEFFKFCGKGANVMLRETLSRISDSFDENAFCNALVPNVPVSIYKRETATDSENHLCKTYPKLDNSII